MDVCKPRLPAILLLATMWLPGCKMMGGGAPGWMENPKTVYPEARYLVAVGEGDTRRAAENAAAANLSRIFEAHIESDERLLDQSHETGKSFERTTDFTTDINILSSQTLYNIQHAEAWGDPNGRYHAVAYLERGETARIYRDKIAKETTTIQFLLAQSEQTNNRLKKYALLRNAARHAAENKILLQQLKVIHPPSMASAAPDYSEDTIRKALADAARQIRVDIDIDGDNDRRIGSCIEELITHYGFIVGRPSTLNIAGRVEVRDTGRRTANLVFVRYELNVQIKDASNDILVSLSEKGREGHISMDEARIRAFRTLEDSIKASGASRLESYFDTLIDPTFR